MKESSKLNERGFAGVLLLFAIIIAAGILLTINMQTKEDYSFKELIPQTKAEISSFSLTLAEMTQNCDTSTCIDQNANNLLLQMDIGNSTNPIYCTIPNQASVFGAKYKLTILCSTNSKIGQNSISLDVNKEIILPLS